MPATPYYIIGERLNTQRERFNNLVIARDPDAVRREARRQIKSGATHIDLNTTRGGGECETTEMVWLLETILPEVPAEVGISLDSTRRESLAAALGILGNRPGTILNSCSASPDKAAAAAALCVELAAGHNSGVIVQISSPDGQSGSAFSRVARAEELRAQMLAAGIPGDRQFFDPQVLPVAFDPYVPAAILEDVREMRRRWPESHLAAGLSNVSFNMPQRGLLNRTYLSMLLAAGLDTVICDPGNKQIRQTLTAAMALLGQDDFFANYLEAFTPED